jgi:hypothetical protein
MFHLRALRVLRGKSVFFIKLQFYHEGHEEHEENTYIRYSVRFSYINDIGP